MLEDRQGGPLSAPGSYALAGLTGRQSFERRGEQMSPSLLTRQDAAQYCSCSVRHIDRAREFGELPFYNLGTHKANSRLIRLKLSDLDKWLAKQRIDVSEVAVTE